MQVYNLRENFRAVSELSRPVFNDICHLKRRRSSQLADSTANFKATKVIHLTRDMLLVTLLKLCGDVALNPGPVQLNLQSPISKGLKICHWNIQRLTTTKQDEIKISLTENSNNSNKIDILFLSETFCTNKTPDYLYAITDYKLFRKDRIGKLGGGVMAFVHKDLKVERRIDMEDDDLEALWLEVNPHKSNRSLFVAGVYRPPSSNVDMDKKLGRNIENAKLRNKELIIMGDLNVDYMTPEKFCKQKLMKSLLNLNRSQLVNQITRPMSQSCLDHIWCSHPERIRQVEVLSSGMSDHLPIVAVRIYKQLKDNKGEHHNITYRDLRNLNEQAFCESLSSAPWDCAFTFDDPDDIVYAWYNIFNSIVDQHAPLRQKRVKRKSQPDWFSKILEDVLKKRDKLLYRARQSQSDSDWSAFRKAKNKATNLLRKTKQTYFKNKVAENRNDPRKLWRLIRELDGVNVKENFTWRLNDGGKLVSDKYQIVEMFNSYFIELPKSILTELINITGDYISPEKRVHSQLEIPHITPEQVNDFLDQIPVNKATGPDGVGIRLLKLAAPVISESLSRIINSCIITGKFPTKWKEASVTPIYKGKGCKSKASNYRPISVLSVLSKVFERHIASSLRAHLKENALLYGLQSGFRKSFSTETALIRLLDQLLFNLDENCVSGLVLVDYKKAFDLIDHNILIKKLFSYGVHGQSLELFKSYLSDRSQYVNVDGVKSSSRPVECGVPQGSILGPILFIIFINDLPDQIKHSVADIYADDTTLSYAHDYSSAPQSITVELQKDITNLADWSRVNHMVLNEEKTKTLLIAGKRLKKKMDTLDILILC